MPGRERSPRVILHIGLHKTGTRFLKRSVFSQLDAAQVNYNPRSMWQAIRQACRRPGNRELADRARAEVAAWRSSGDNRNLLPSEPHISGDMYGGHHDYPQNLELIRELFPEATVIFFVRNQSDWLQSAYRQQLVKDKGVPIEVFLNWYDGEFRARAGRWVYGVRNVEALSLRFLSIYGGYAQVYGGENVYMFRQEDLRLRSDDVKYRLTEALGLDGLPEPPVERRHNRSYSALAMSLFYPGVHRSYPAPTTADCGEPMGRVRRLTRPLRRFRRVFIQHGFDKIIYKDWDLLARHGMRERIDAYYADENVEIERIAGVILDHGPQAVTSLEDVQDGTSRA